MLLYKNRSLILGLALCGISSCKIPKVAMLPQRQTLPEKFATTNASGSNTIQTVMDQYFFSDTCLQQLINDVLKGNPDIQIALQRLEISGAYLKMRKGALLPSVQGRARASGTRFSEYTMEGVGNFDTNISGNIDEDQKVNTNLVPDYWLGVNVSWEADLWGKLKNRKKAAQQHFWATEAAQQWLQILLTARTAQLYYELMITNEEREVLRDNIELQQKALEIVKVQMESGSATKLAVIQFASQKSSTEAVLKENELKRNGIINQLNFLAGRYSGTIICSNIMPYAAFEMKIATGIPATLLANRPDIKEAALLLEAAHADAKAARASFFPSLNISAYTALNAFSGNVFFSGASIGYQLLGGLTAPIFQRHKIRSRFKIANASQEEAFYVYEKRSLRAYKEVIDQLQSLQSNHDIIRVKEEQVASLTEGVLVANELYLNGYANYLEIIEAQKSKLKAELELINTQQRIIRSMISLYKATGGA